MKLQYRGLADRRLAAVALAVRLYWVEHAGTSRRTWTILSRNTFPMCPPTHSSTGAAIGYFSGDPNALAHANDPIVYSVGDNGTDEGGSEKMTYGSPDGIVTGLRTEDTVVHLTPQPRKPGTTIDDL